VSIKKQILILVVVIILAYIPTLSNGFVNWDDDVHLLENPFIQTLDWSHLKSIFSTTVNKIYIPLTSISFAVERHFFGTNAFVYHLNNLLLHICVSGLVFFFARICGLVDRAALIAAILFGIHPMHVESVSWITERKDVLYSCFYLLALINYCHYLKIIKKLGFTGKAKGAFIFVIMFGVLSMLAKPMALSLPFIMVLCDWYFNRKFSLRAVIEKVWIITFFVPIAWMSYIYHARVPGIELGQSLLTWIWCLTFYPIKFFTLDYFVLFYRLPTPVSLNNLPYILSMSTFLALLTLLFVFRKNRLFVFAVLYYFLSIFFLLEFDVSSDINIVADRFMYLASMGWCLFLGRAGHHALLVGERKGSWKIIFYGITMAFFFALGLMTFNQCKVWKSGVSLWEHQLKTEPQAVTALVYQKLAQAKMAEDTFNINNKQEVGLIKNFFYESLKIYPNYANAYWGIGELNFKDKKYHEAEKNLIKAITLEPDHFAAYFRLGCVYYKIGDKVKGLSAFISAIKMSPGNEILKQKILRFYEDGVEYKDDRDVFEKEYKKF